ncbi:MAG: hypothetical protein JNN05_09200 [Candidatus Omnitrophica bacterium]|nr:hypothetical protein [Candidatus Omnitrophota bacterium]
MKKNPGVIKRLFFFCQLLILVVTMSLSVLYVSLQYFRQTSQIWLETIDKTAQLVLHHVKTKKEAIQGQEEGSYLVYVLNQADGTYAFEPPKRSPDGQVLWERYSKKLIYEMQKQKQGWIFYPEKAANPIPGYQQVIRYLPIDESGWIVAVESSMPVGITKTGNVFDYRFFTFFFVVMSVGVLALGYLTKRNFETMRKVIADSVESNLLSLNKEEFFHPNENNSQDNLTIKPASKSSPADLEASQTLGSSSFEKGAEEEPLLAKNPVNFKPQGSVNITSSAQMDSLGQKLDHPEKSTAEQYPNQTDSVEKENPSVAGVPKGSKMNLDEKMVSPENSGELQGVTINLQNIKSEALKKIISDFRKKK